MNSSAHDRTQRNRLCLLGSAILTCALGVQGAPVRGPLELPSPTRQEIQNLLTEKDARTPARRKLDSQLVYALREQRQQPIAPGVPLLRHHARVQADGRLLVDLRATVTPDLLRRIEAGGGQVVNSFAPYRTVRAVIPLELAEILAERADVQHVRPADEAMANAGSVVSQGDVAHRADAARSTFRVDGAGLKIGVLSDSVDFLAYVQASGDLPVVNILPGQAGTGIGEGTAMLEIVHDLAPGAVLYFATAFNGVASFAQNIRDLHAAGCRVIVDDVTYFVESPFQDGPIAQAVNEVCAAGALFFSSAANSGNKNDGTSGTWEGDFTDGGPATVERGGRVHDFGGGVLFNTVLPGGSYRRVDLFWADPLGASTNDYDVYVLNESGSVVSSSSNVQDGNDDPYESIPTLSLGQRIVIVKSSGDARYLHLSTSRAVLAVSTSGATRGHNAAVVPNAFSVAATWVRPAPIVPFSGGSVNPVELFSSDGPRKMFFYPDGTPITPGDFSSTGGQVYQKPDLTAADGVATASPVFARFFGTSAAAPHAAAIAALVWSYNPSLTPAAVRGVLTSTALDIEAPGVDGDSGVGIVMALESLIAAPPPAPRLFFESAALAGGNGNGALDAAECGDLYVSMRNLITAAGEPATGVTAVLRSTNATVIVDPTPQSFQDVPASGTGSNAAPFRLSTAPLFVCGEPVAFELLVIASNAPSVRFSFTLPSTPPSVGVPVPFAAADAPRAIPDQSFIESTVSVAGITLPIGKVTVSLHVDHTYDSDLAISLIGPDGTTVDLTSGNGGSGANYGASCSSRTAFDDAAGRFIVTGSAPFAGTFAPEQPLAAFNGKAGAAVNGEWRLRVADVQELDTGTLQCWMLEIAPIHCLDGGGQCLLPPAITVHPQNAVATNGDNVLFAAAAEGTAPLSYQWHFNETQSVPDATNAMLVLTGVSPAQAGSYAVVVSNLFGAATSSPAQLTVVVPPHIVAEPQDQFATNGLTAEFTVVAEGTPPLNYQWYFNETTPLPDATNATLQLVNVTDEQAGRFSALVRSPYGEAASSAALLTVVVPAFITVRPQSQTVAEGTTVHLFIEAGGTAPLSYQWYFNETNQLPDETNATLTLAGVTTNQAGSYSVVVSNPYGSAASAPAELTVVVRNDPPLVAITAPADGTTLQLHQGPFVVEATADDPNGTVQLVEFFADGSRVGEAWGEPYRFEWADPTVGPAALQAVATDNGGASATSTVVQVRFDFVTNLTLLIPTGAVWKYLDTGVDQGTAWREPGFDDSTWASGPAQLGYGDNDEATVVSFGPDATNKFVTTYFRRPFVLSEADSLTNVELRVLRDDGVVVYLNGVEVFRNNLPAGSLSFTNFALTAIGGAAELAFLATNVPAHLLTNGTNVVAVEIHQSGPTSSDISFALELAGQRNFAPRILAQPESQSVPDGATVLLAVTAAGAKPLTYQWFSYRPNQTNTLADATNATLVLSNVTPVDSGVYAVRVTNTFGLAFSTGAVLGVIGSNVPPLVALLSPTNGAMFTQNVEPIPVEAAASDPDGTITDVRFYSDDRLLATLRTPPYRFDWLDAPAGDHTLFAMAMDNEGVRRTSAVALISVQFSTNRTQLVPLGAGWKYWDTGEDLGTAWRQLAFDDSAWASGPAQLGYGDGDEATVVSYGPDLTNKFVTTYFRRTLFVTDAAAFTNLSARLLRDDGAVVYLNDVEVFRSNMPTGEITASTLAASTVGGAAETNFFAATLPPEALRSGLNALAVEVHQILRNSTDISFDFELTAERLSAPVILVQPRDDITSVGGTAAFSVVAFGTPSLRYQWFFQTDAIADATNATLALTGVSPAQAGSYAVVVSNLFGALASDRATLTVNSSNMPPVVQIIQPAESQSFDTAAPIVIEAEVTDLDSTIAKVEFFADSQSLGESWAAPYRFAWLDAPVGEHMLYAVATDEQGARGVAEPVSIAVNFSTNPIALVATGAVWKYLDDGSDQGTVWRNLGFGDALWSDGPAELGYGDNDEATVVSFGPDSANKYVTTYFRHTFVLTDATRFSALSLAVLRDDGAVVYLNGEEVFRDNLPTNDIAFDTRALVAIGGAAESNYLTRPLPAGLLRNGTNVAAVEIHQANATSSDISFNLALLAQRRPHSTNQPPTVVLKTPQTGDRFAFGSPIPMEAEAADADDPVGHVSFYASGIRLGDDSTPPYQFTWLDAPPGLHLVWAMALDISGASATSAVALVLVNPPTLTNQTLVATGAVWRYLDTGEDQGTQWREANCDDSGWSSGPAELGYGEGDEATVVSYGPDPDNRYITTYFRHHFVVDKPEAFTGLLFRILRDDGAVVYVNGVEVFRSNMPDGTIEFLTRAVSVVQGRNETNYFTREFDAATLVQGTNVIAVEVHQVRPRSDDVSFDMELIGQRVTPPLIAAQPRDQMVTNGDTAVFSVTALGAEPLTYQWYFTFSNALTLVTNELPSGTSSAPDKIMGLISSTRTLPDATNATFEIANVSSNDAGRYFVAVSNPGGTTFSDAATLTVIVPPPNLPPVLALLQPTNGATFFGRQVISLQATADDSDGRVMRVEFFADQALLGTVAEPPYIVDWVGAPLGPHELRVVATDDLGATTLSDPVLISVVPELPASTLVSLVATGAVWKYLDTGEDQGTAWRLPDFDDSSWAQGPAELGYGDSPEGRPEATLLGFGPDPDNKYPTYYFRHAFLVTNAAALTEIHWRILRDDGVVIYLNGEEVLRDNLPPGDITFATWALEAIVGASELELLEANLPAGRLREGSNVLAVEIHQVNGKSSDISLDLALAVVLPSAPVITQQPEDQTVVRGATAQFSVTAAGIEPLLYQWFLNGLIALPDETNRTLVIPNAQAEDEGSYSVVVTNRVGSVQSAAAVLTVLVQGNPPVITSQPQNVTLFEGGTAVLSVVATGSEPLAYQWWFNSNHMAGAMSETLVLPNVTPTDSGDYQVVVSNPNGSATSQPATVRVLVSAQMTMFVHAGTETTIAFETVNGLRYTVEYMDDLVALGAWTVIPGALKIKGLGEPITVTDFTANVPQRFYRVRVE